MGKVKRKKIISVNVYNDSNSVPQFLRWLIFVLLGTNRIVLGLVSVPLLDVLLLHKKMGDNLVFMVNYYMPWLGCAEIC
jgi:hypothetical protein